MDSNNSAARPVRPGPPVRSWPVVLLALPAFVAIWSGWVGLGGMTGFGIVRPLPGIWDAAQINTAITLPIGMEIYAAYALRVWLSGQLPPGATAFAKWSAIGSLALGAAGQIAYHLMAAAGVRNAPWQITAVVACLPVAVLGMGAALAHLVHEGAAVAESVKPVEPGEATVDAADDDVSDVPAAGEPSPRPAPRPAPRSVPRVERRPVEPSTRTARTSGGRRTGTAATVARLRARHPKWTVAQIAERAGVTERTVRRHLNAPAADTAADHAAEATSAGGQAA